jgi:hypothetical protein
MSAQGACAQASRSRSAAAFDRARSQREGQADFRAQAVAPAGREGQRGGVAVQPAQPFANLDQAEARALRHRLERRRRRQMRRQMRRQTRRRGRQRSAGTLRKRALARARAVLRTPVLDPQHQRRAVA